jgi:uncharacterized protein with von Willebrand factor type A (vWA) domain
MTLNDWPFIDLFTRLRDAGLPLGVEDYQLLLLAIKGNFVEDCESLYRVCCTIWVKSDEDKHIFDMVFDEFISHISHPLTLTIPTIKQTQLWNNAWSRQFSQFTRNLILGGLFIAAWIILLLVGQINERKVETILEFPTQDLSRILEELTPPESPPDPPISSNKSVTTPISPEPSLEPIFSSANLRQVDNDLEQIKEVNLTSYQIQQQLGVTDILFAKIDRKVKFFKKSGITLKHFEKKGRIIEKKQIIKKELNSIFEKINKCAEFFRKLKMITIYDPSKDQGQISDLTTDEIEKLRLSPEQFQKLRLPPDIIQQLKNIREPMKIKSGRRNSAPTELITIVLLLAIAIVARLVTARRRMESASTPEAVIPKTTIIPESVGITPPIADFNDEVSQSCYVPTDMCLPVTRRQMQQSWRYLCRRVREGAAVELDVEATINKMGHQGMLLELVQVPRRINRSELLLLIDQGGSMVPFHIASRQLVETVLHGGRLGKIDIYYFHNSLNNLYLNPNLQGESITFTEVFSYLHPQYTSVMIFSDGGAARRKYNTERFSSTLSFLEKLRQRVRHIAWLNPVPRDRWTASIAGNIAKNVPMFEFDCRGLRDAINVLQGKLKYTQPND